MSFQCFTRFFVLSFLFIVLGAQSSQAACSLPAGVGGQMGYGITGIGRYQYCNDTDWLTVFEGQEGPLVHFKFDETSGNFAYDSVSGYSLPLVNSSTWVGAGGEIGGAVNFAGASSQGLGTNSLVIDVGVPVTYSFWIRPTSTSAAYAAFMISDNSNGVWFDPSSDIMVVYVSDNPDLTSSSSIANGVWTHVAITDNGSTSKLYINGAEEDSVASSVYFAIKRIGTGLWEDYPFDGRIDDFRIYNRVLGAAEIVAVYNKTIPDYACTAEKAINYASVSKHFTVCRDGILRYFEPAATGAACAVVGQLEYASNVYSYCDGANWIPLSTVQIAEPTANLTQKWQLDEAAGGVADNAVSGSDGTLQNGATWQAAGGRIGGALQFDGVDDNVSLPSLVLSPSFSLAFWMKRTVDVDANYMGIITQDGFQGVWHNENSTAITLFNADGDVVMQGGAVKTNIWAHVVVTDDGATSRLYVDGVEVVSSGDRVGFTLNSFAGSFGGGDDVNFQGLLDDVRVYNAALTPTQIQHLYLSAP